MLPSSFMMQAIKPSLLKYNTLYTDFTLKPYKKNKSKALLGILVESQLITILSKGDIEFSFHLKNEMATSKNIKY
jgi:hypothetical protein